MQMMDKVQSLDSSVPEKKYRIEVLQLVKTAQAQHGLRLGDYKRYRKYCTARLKRLHKSLKFTHGKTKFIRKEITEAVVTDVRYLHILLYSAERAWSYAMDIKQAMDKKTSRQRFHLLARLAKAVKWADSFSQLCSVKTDAKTTLEAMAYASYIKGSYLLEHESNWENALKNFRSARAVYEELGKFGDVEIQILCRQRVEELEPSVRYCLYKMGQSNIHSTDILEMSIQDSPALDLLQDKLEAVMAEARSQQAETLTDIEWLGRRFPVNNAKTRVCILKAQQLERDALSNISATNLTLEKKLTIYDKVFAAYQDAKWHIRDDLVMAGSAEDVKDNLNGLDKAIGCLLLQRTIDRNHLLVILHLNRSARQQHNVKEEKAEKNQNPGDLVRLYDTLIQNVTDLHDLTTSGREMNSEEVSYAEELDAKRLNLSALRCFYLAQSYSTVGNYAEAYVLLGRAKDHIDAALKGYQKLKGDNKTTIQELKDLADRCRAQRCLVHATGVDKEAKIQESLQKGVQSISLKPSRRGDVEYLVDKLAKYEPVVGNPGSKEPPRIMQLPPAFQPVPCKPIVLDTAVTAIDFPSLESRFMKEEKRKSLFGWWRS